MARSSRSLTQSILSAGAMGIVAAMAGYAVYRFFSKRSTGRESHGGRILKGAAVHRTDRPTIIRADNTSAVLKNAVTRTKVTWIPELRAREQKILSHMPMKQSVKMADIASKFPSVTDRTLRRDMEKLLAKGKIKRVGATRARTYVRV